MLTSNSMIVVADAAQLGALAVDHLVGPAPLDRQVELVDTARDDVALEQELRDVERVDDVVARQEEVGRLARREVRPPSGAYGVD